MKLWIGVVLGLVLGIGGTLFFQQVTVKTARANGEPVVNTAIPYRNGDVNGSDPVTVDMSDAVYILQWLFSGGPPPKPFLSLPATGHNQIVYAGDDATYQAGCPSAGRFVDNGDGTVTDNCTGLMWQKENPPALYSWRQAIDYCEGLEFAGHDDWRLPNVRELLSIVDYWQRIDPVFVTQHLSDTFWSSTPVGTGGYAWWVEFIEGRIDKVDINFEFAVRAVRNEP